MIIIHMKNYKKNEELKERFFTSQKVIFFQGSGGDIFPELLLEAGSTQFRQMENVFTKYV